MNVKQSPSVGGIILNSQNEVLLVNEGDGFWGFPKGRPEKDETLLETATREIAEETGLTEITKIAALGSYQRHPVWQGVENKAEIKDITLFLFQADQELPNTNLESNECRWFPVAQVSDKLSHIKDRQFFEQVASGIKPRSHIGLKRGAVQVASYSLAWPQLFIEEKQHLLVALGNKVHAIEHIGSTSVPGLSAKPIIDMVGAIDDLEDYEKFVKPLESLGYEFMPERVFSDRVFFPKGPRQNRTHHLSLVLKDSPGWYDPIRFRDYLIANPKVREGYQKLKLELASKYPKDRASYTKAKETIIQGIIDKI